MAEGKEFGFGFKLTLNDQLTQGLTQAAAGINQFSGQFNGFISLVKYATSALVSFYATSRVIQQIRQLINVGENLEQTQVQLQALTGSLKEARGLYEFARQKAIELPFGNTQQILNAMKSMELFGFNARKDIDAIAKLSAVSGESLEGVTYRLNYFVQSGGTFARSVSTLFGKDTKELIKNVKGLAGDELRDAVIRFVNTTPKFKDAINTQRNTLAGLRDDIGDIKTAFGEDILNINSESGLLGGYKRFLRQIRNFLVEHKDGLKQIALSIGRALGGIFDILGQAFTRMTKGFGDWINSTGGFLSKNQDLITQFVFWLGLIELRIENILKVAWDWTNKIANALGGWKVVAAGLAAFGAVGAVSSIGGAIANLSKIFGGAIGPKGLLIDSIAALVAVNIVGWNKAMTQYNKLTPEEKSMQAGLFIDELGKMIGFDWIARKTGLDKMLDVQPLSGYPRQGVGGGTDNSTNFNRDVHIHVDKPEDVAKMPLMKGLNRSGAKPNPSTRQKE